jgi:hypothetical protein
MAVMRSVASVVAGIATFSLFLLAMMSLVGRVLGSDADWINRSTATQLAWLLWNVVSMIAAGYVVACIAPKAASAHVAVMGAVQMVFTLVAMFTAGDTVTPLWLWLGGIVTNVPAAWAGARLRIAGRESLAPR